MIRLVANKWTISLSRSGYSRCKLPDESANSTFNSLTSDQLNNSYPWDAFKKNYSSCYLFDQKNHSVTCNEFIFEQDVYGYTAVTEVSRQASINSLQYLCLIITMNSFFTVGINM